MLTEAQKAAEGARRAVEGVPDAIQRRREEHIPIVKAVGIGLSLATGDETAVDGLSDAQRAKLTRNYEKAADRTDKVVDALDKGVEVLTRSGKGDFLREVLDETQATLEEIVAQHRSCADIARPADKDAADIIAGKTGDKGAEKPGGRTR